LARGAMPAQQAEPEPETENLGAFVAAFPGRAPPSIVLWIAFFGLIWAGATGRVTHSWALGVTAGAALIGLPALLLRRSARGRGVDAYADGFVYRTRRKSQVWRWADIDDLFVVAEQREVHSRPKSVIEFLIETVVETITKALLPKRAKYRVLYRLTGQGRKLTINWTIRDHHELGMLVSDRLKERRMPSLIGSLRAGETLHFGRLDLGPEGLIDTRPKTPKLLPWNALPTVSESRYGVVVNEAGRKRPWITAEGKDVPNANILAAITAAVVAERGSASGDTAGTQSAGSSGGA
jgi:Family of unknown function (DUF6585)